MTAKALAAPKPRIDKTPEAYLTRLLKTIKTPDADPVLRYQGIQVGPLTLRKTDGSRAVLVPGTDGTVFDGPLPPFLRRRPQTTVELTGEFHLALKRMLAVAGPRKWVTLTLDPHLSELRLQASDNNPEVEGTEAVPIVGTHLRRAVVVLNGKFVDDAMGRWPVTLRLGAPDQPVLFENDVCTYVLSPVQAATVPTDLDDAQAEPWLDGAPVPATEDGAMQPMTVPAAVFARFRAAYSADRIGEDKPVKPVAHDGHLYTIVSLSGSRPNGDWSGCEGYRLVPVADWTGEAPQTYRERSNSDRRGRQFYPGMLVRTGGKTGSSYVLSAERYRVTLAPLATEVPMVVTERRPAPTPPAPPASRPLAAAGPLHTYRYAWPGNTWSEPGVPAGQQPFEGTIEAPSVAAAKAAIRARHGFQKWVPTGTVVEKIAASTAA